MVRLATLCGLLSPTPASRGSSSRRLALARPCPHASSIRSRLHSAKRGRPGAESCASPARHLHCTALHCTTLHCTAVTGCRCRPPSSVPPAGGCAPAPPSVVGCVRIGCSGTCWNGLRPARQAAIVLEHEARLQHLLEERLVGHLLVLVHAVEEDLDVGIDDLLQCQQHRSSMVSSSPTASGPSTQPLVTTPTFTPGTGDGMS